MTTLHQTIDHALPEQVATPPSDPWPALRVVARDGVEELMFVHEPRPRRQLAGARPRGAGPTAAVLIVPTIDAPAGDYQPLAVALSRAGMGVARAELRGQGHSRAELGPGSGYAELIEQALPTMIASVRRRWPRSPLYLLGHGAGAQLACLFAAGWPAEIDGLILVDASGAEPWRERIAKLVRALVPGSHQPRARLLDWARSGRRLVGSERDWTQALGRVRLPTLAFSLSAPAPHGRRAQARDLRLGATEALLARMPKARCTRRRLVDRRAGRAGLAQGESLAEQVDRWHRQPRNRTGPRICLAAELLR
jgi:pimeloyl-ACP methyl ester carboxylesterase